MVRNYIEWLLALPWSRPVPQMIDLDEVTRRLDAEHFGLDKVKERILEYLAVLKLKNDLKGPILCFAGPPGTGKTSLGSSIARAMGRDFVQMSVGGVRDAEGGPGVAAGAAVGGAVAAGAERPVHDPLDAGTVQCDEGMRTQGRLR